MNVRRSITLLCNIEAVLNSRPLTPLSNDPNDLSALTPAHFIFGDSLDQPEQFDVSGEPDNRLTHWQLLRKSRQRLWQRWKEGYLQELQKRVKWNTTSQHIKVGDLVLFIEDNVPPLKWPRGRVVKVYPGADGTVRVVDVRTSARIYKRSIQKICLLPLDDKKDSETDEKAA